MGDFIDDLTGGFFKKKKNEPGVESTGKGKDKIYNVCIQFDDDEPLIFYKDVNKKDTVTLEFKYTKNKDENYIEFKCPKTGKKFKIFVE